MVTITDKKKCSGCSACSTICPKKCIHMKQDEEGFLYPEIDKEQCIKCGLCSKICPVLNTTSRKEEFEDKAYAIYHRNEEIRKDSTSGGFFTALAENIIDENGVVFGAGFDENFEVRHTFVNKKEELEQFRGSKYVQSKIGDCYQKAIEFLEEGRKVLFTGTPCQIYGLYAVLKKNYENLYCMDVICKGVPSPAVWRKYIQYQQKRKKSTIRKVRFREKTYGFSSTTMSIYYHNKKEYHKGHESDEMLNLFVKELISRPSCHACQFKIKERISDFTIGDCWKVETMLPEMKDDKGVTLLITHSKKAEEMLKTLKPIICKEINLDKALELNGGNKESMYTASAIPNEKRNSFYRDFQTKEFEEVLKIYSPKTIKTKIKSIAKPILYRLGILNKMKKMK